MVDKIRMIQIALASSVITFLKGKFLIVFQPLFKIYLSSLPQKAVMLTQKMIQA